MRLAYTDEQEQVRTTLRTYYDNVLLLLMKQLELQLGSATPTLAHLGRHLAAG